MNMKFHLGKKVGFGVEVDTSICKVITGESFPRPAAVPSMTNSPSPSPTLLLTFLDVGYYTCFLPFKIRLNDEGYYTLREYWLQKIVTITFMVLLTIFSTFMYICVVVGPSKDPVFFFEIGKALLGGLHSLAFLQVSLCSKSYFQNLFELLRIQGGKDREGKARLKRICFILGIIIIYYLYGSYEMWQAYFLPYFNNFLTMVSIQNEEFPEGSVLSNVVIGILGVLFSFYRGLAESCSVLVFLLGWYLRGMCEILKDHIIQGRSCQEILDEYLLIQRVNQEMNSISKYLIITGAIGSIPFISMDGMDLSLKEPLAITSFCFSILGFMSCMVGSAEAHAKAGELKNVLLNRMHGSRRGYGDRQDILTPMLLNEFSSKGIGLRGMNFFTMTYSFVGVMLSQCVVYALIILQLKQGENSSGVQ